MPKATPPLDTPENHDVEKPNHMIIWLDGTIGNPKEYIHLKKAFGSNTDPRHETWTMLTDNNYHDILAEEDAVTVTFEGVVFLLQAVDNEVDCLKAFENNQDKHIFFITSGLLGKNAVPQVIERYRHIFTDPITDKPYSSVYVFCHNIEWNLEWAVDYLDYVQMFNFDSELLERLIRDIAKYFIERSRRIRQDNDLEGALRHLHWAKILWQQSAKVEQNFSTDNPQPVRESEETKKIDALIAEIEAELPNKSSDHDDANSDDDDTKACESSS
jgi:hypothetical protein